MRIGDIAAAGYRSLRAIRFPVGRLTVFVGQNGVGKTNLYRSLQLLQAAAAGTLARELAGEGGMESALWAGKRASNKPVRIKLAVGFVADRGRNDPDDGSDVAAGPAQQYAIEVGIRAPTAAAFLLEPQVKEESLTWRNGGRTVALLERKGPSASARNEDGKREALGTDLLASETALGALQDPSRFPAIHVLRRTMLDWRFYHDFRTDRGAPLRQPCLAVTTPTLASDGADLAAVFATLVHLRGDTVDLDRAIDGRVSGRTAGRPRAGAHRLVRPDAARVPQARVRGGRTVGRHAALSRARRRAPRLSAAGVRGAERAGDQPAPRPASIRSPA